MLPRVTAGGWQYVDAWNQVPAEEFTTSVFHLTHVGESMLAALLAEPIRAQSCR